MTETQTLQTQSRILFFFANLVCVIALLPFVSIFPRVLGGVRTDVQLMGTMAASLALVVIFAFEPRQLTVTGTDLAILFLGILSLIYVDWFKTKLDLQWIRSTGQILLGFPVYYFIRNLYRYISPWTLIFVVSLYVLAIFLQLAAPAIYFRIAPMILSDIRGGISGLTQEPSQMATLAIFFLLIPLVFQKNFWRSHPRALLYMIFCSSLAALLSKSATSILLTVLLVGTWLFFLSRLRLRWKVALFICCAVAILILRNVENPLEGTNRALGYAQRIAQNPVYAFQDTSLAMRQAGLYVGLVNLPRIPYGTALVSTDYSLVATALTSRIMNSLVDPEGRELFFNYALGTYVHPTYGFLGGGISMLGQSIQRMGIFYLAILGFLLTLIKGPRESILFKILFLAFVVNGPIVMSVIWFIFGIFVAQRKG
jgi:hypothetical protein